MRDERGQAMMELGFILLLIIMLTAGVIDVSRGFYQYNAVGAAARYGSRWASIVGGLCANPLGGDTSDWCNQFSTHTTPFWSQPGNAPLQAPGVNCPTTYDPNFTGYYLASNYHTTTATTIVGAVSEHFDSSEVSTGFTRGNLMTSLTLSDLKICIQLTWDATHNWWSTQPGDKVVVWVYYPFHPVTTLLTLLHTINLSASSEFRID
jgi:TadE-like protein